MSVVDFITVKDGIVTGYHSGNLKADFVGTKYHDHERIAVPANSAIKEGDKTTFYNKSWMRKSEIQLIKEGLIAIPEGYILEGDVLREMTAEERILSGVDELEPGYKIENRKIIQMSLEEQLESGQITQEEYKEKISQQNLDE